MAVVETGGGDGSETGLMMEEGKKCLVLVPASPRTAGIKRRAIQLLAYCYTEIYSINLHNIWHTPLICEGRHVIVNRSSWSLSFQHTQCKYNHMQLILSLNVTQPNQQESARRVALSCIISHFL